eukprot:225257_1
MLLEETFGLLVETYILSKSNLVSLLSPLRMWVMLQCKSGSGPLSVTSPFGCGAWEIQPAVQDRVGKAGYDLTNQRSSNLFRFLRLRSTGRNGEAGLGLPICRIEFFGSLHARPDL